MVSKEVSVVILVFLSGFCTSSDARLDGVQERGPILFPRNEGDEEDVGNASNVITIPKNNQVSATPYEKFKRKYINVGDTAQKENLNKEVFQALARHGSKVLRVPPESLGKDHVPVTRKSPKKNYAFSYKVVDSATGDDFSHSQVRTAKATNGEYRVRLPDGRLQIVKYTADKNGYKADVRYEEDEVSRSVHEESVGNPNNIPDTSQLQLSSTNSIHNQVYYKDIKTTDTSGSPSAGQQTVSPSASALTYHPAELQGLGAYRGRQNEQVPHPLNVQIYTSNARDYSMGFFPVLSTAPPLLHKEFERYPNSAIAPHIVTYAERGIIAPVTNHKDNSIRFVTTSTPTPTPTTFLVLDHHGQIVDTYHLVAPSTTVSTVVG